MHRPLNIYIRVLRQNFFFQTSAVGTANIHLSLMIFVEIFSNSRTDFLRSADRVKIRDPNDTDMANQVYNTNMYDFMLYSNVSCNFTHFQGSIFVFIFSKSNIFKIMYEYQFYKIKFSSHQ